MATGRPLVISLARYATPIRQYSVSPQSFAAWRARPSAQFMGWFSALSVGAVQLYLSMRIRSFAVPVGLAVCLSIGGLAFHIAGLSEMFPYSQIILGLSSQDEVLPIDSITTLVPMVLVYTVLFVILATNHLKKADVVAG